MLTQTNRHEIEELVKEGASAISKWLDTVSDQLTEAPEEYSGEIIDKRPEKKRKVIEPLDFESENDFDMCGPVMEIDVGHVIPNRWLAFKLWFKKKILRIKEKSEEEEINDLLEEYSPFKDLHKKAEGDIVEELITPKDMLPDMTILKQAIAYAELMFPIKSDWDVVRKKCEGIRATLNSSLKPTRSSAIQNSKGSRIALDVEISKEVEIPPEVISQHIMAAKQQRR